MDTTTLRVNGERKIDSTTIAGASGVYRSAIGVGVDHELRRNLILNADFGIGKEEFEDIDRDDDLWRLSFGGRYLMNRYLQIVAGFRHDERDTDPSDSGGRVYEINEIFVRLVGQL